MERFIVALISTVILLAISAAIVFSNIYALEHFGLYGFLAYAVGLTFIVVFLTL
jgi:hypothetical protein